MGCVELMEDMNMYHEKLDDIRFDYQKEASRRIKQFVDECLYEDFLEMIQQAYLNEDQVFEDVWVTKLKLTDLHKIAMFYDFNEFEEAYNNDRSWE
jgi:hypothetical protein